MSVPRKGNTNRTGKMETQVCSSGWCRSFYPGLLLVQGSVSAEMDKRMRPKNEQQIRIYFYFKRHYNDSTLLFGERNTEEDQGGREYE
jgi:hypothetical protein